MSASTENEKDKKNGTNEIDKTDETNKTNETNETYTNQRADEEKMQFVLYTNFNQCLDQDFIAFNDDEN